MDVRELLELERALERGRVVHASAEEEKVASSVVAIRKRTDLGLLAKYRIDERGKVERFSEELPGFLAVDRSAALSEVDRKEVEVDKHRGVGLRRRDADLRSCVQIDDIVGHAAGLASDDVDHREQARALLLRLLHRRERVDRLAALGDRDDELSFRDRRLAVAVLARDLHIAGNARDALDQVLADERRLR